MYDNAFFFVNYRVKNVVSCVFLTEKKSKSRDLDKMLRASMNTWEPWLLITINGNILDFFLDLLY